MKRFFLVLTLFLSFIPLTLAAPYDLSDAEYTGTSISTQDDVPRDLAWNDDGTKLYEIGNGNDKIYEYDVNTPYDISTASYSGTNINTQDSVPAGLAWNDDGTKLYELGGSGEKIFEYDLSTPYDISTASYNGVNINIQDSSPTGLAWNGDGTKLYEIGNGNDKIYEYDLSVPYDISTASYNGVSISTQDGNARGMAWNGDGTKLYEIGISNDKIYEYDVNTPYDISTASYNGVSISTQDGNARGMAWNGDGTKLYEIGLDSDKIYEYDLGPGNFTLTASDAFDNASLQNISANLTGQNSGTTYSLNTTTGTITTPVLSNSSELWEIDVSSPTYETKTFEDYNVSTNLEASLRQAESKFSEARTRVTNKSLTDFNITIEGQTFSSNNTFSSPTEYNATFTKTGWYDLTQTFNASLNNAFTDVYNSKFTVQVQDENSQTLFDNFTATIEHSSGYSETQNTTNNTVGFNLEKNETYNLTIDGEIIPLQTQEIFVENTTQTSVLETLQERTILFKYKDTETQNTIQTVTSSLTNTETDNNIINTTTNGEQQFPLLAPARYRTVHNASTYATNTYYVTVTPESQQTKEIYLTKNTTALPLSINVVDEATNPLEGILVSIQRYYSDQNSYITITESLTNFQGQATLSPPEDDAYYKIQFTNREGDVLETTEPLQLRDDNYQFTLNTDATTSLQEFNQYQALEYNLSYNQDTENFRAIYNQQGQTNTLCLRVETIKTTMPNTETGKQCSTSSSGTLIVPRTNTNNTQRATLTLQTNEDTYTVSQIQQNFKQQITLGATGLIAQLIITLVVAGIGITIAPTTLLITLPGSLLLGYFIGINTIPIYTHIALIVAGITMLYATNRRTR